MSVARLLAYRPIVMKLFQSDKFHVLVDQLERTAYELAECGRELHGKEVTKEVLIAAALTRASERL